VHQFLKQLEEAWKTGYEYVSGSPIVLKRSDINSVMSNSGTILNDRRISEALETTVELRKTGAAAVADASHQSRKGKADFYPTLEHSSVMNRLLREKYPDDYLEWEYLFSETCWGLTQFGHLTHGRNVLSNNIRFAPWELRVPHNLFDTPPVRLVEKLRDAGHRICYVQDAFPSAHRGGNQKDTSMLVLPLFFKRRGLPVFPSKAFAEEMRKYAQLNELVRKSKKVIVALFGGKVTDYLDVLSLYKRHDNIEFIAGSLLSLIFLKSQNPNLSLGVTEERFFKDITAKELTSFKEHYDPERIHLAKDIIEQTPEELIIKPLDSKIKIRYEVQGIGPETVGFYTDLVVNSQVLIVNGCPFDIRRFETFGGYFKDFMTAVRKQNSGLKIYECGGDAITAIKFSGVKTDISSTAGKLGLLAPMIETEEELKQFVPAVVPLIN
jgi:3-phosphoglycerate kinase